MESKLIITWWFNCWGKANSLSHLRCTVLQAHCARCQACQQAWALSRAFCHVSTFSILNACSQCVTFVSQNVTLSNFIYTHDMIHSFSRGVIVKKLAEPAAFGGCFPLSFCGSVCCFVLLTRRWGRLKTSSSCPGIFSRTHDFYYVRSPSSPFAHLLDGHRKLVECSAVPACHKVIYVCVRGFIKDYPWPHQEE